MVETQNLLYESKELHFDNFNRDYLLTWEKSPEQIKATLIIAEILKELHSRNISAQVFQSGLGISLFRDNSTRTRLAYASACDLLGLAHQEMDEQKSQVYHGETVRETANMISFLTETIGIRDDMFIGLGHSFMQEMADSLEEGVKSGGLPPRTAVINLQSDLDHPTQTLADLAHLKNYYGKLEILRGKKIVMSWAYSPSYGKPLSVPQGIIALMSRMGMNVVLAHPNGYELEEGIVKQAKLFAEESGGEFSVSHDMKKAFKDADIVYPKSWASYRIMEQRTRLVQEKKTEELKALEQECLKENAGHKKWICDEKLMAATRDGNALYMHCLPADIAGVNCEDGEVSKGVFEKYRVETYKEAGWKPFIIAAMIMLCRFPEPVKVLEQLYQNNVPRRG